MALELFLSGQKVDLLPGTVIAMSYSNNIIGEAIQPSGSSSNQFNLPKSQPNRDIVESAESINSDTDFPYQKIPARLIQNGRELISDGFAILEESSEFYDLVVYGGNLDFFEVIRGRKLRDLDLSQFDHIWNFFNVINSRGFTEGYIYPIIDWNDDEAFMDNLTDKVDPRTMYHAVFIHTIMDAIFNEASFNKSGSILTDSRYLEMVVPVVDTLVSEDLKDDRKTIARRQPNLTQNFTAGNDVVRFLPVTMPDTSLGDVYGFWTQKNFFTNLGGTFNTFGYTSQATTKYAIKFTGRNHLTGIQLASLQVWRVKPSGVRTILIAEAVTIPFSTFVRETEADVSQGDSILVIMVTGDLTAIGGATATCTNPVIEITPISNKNIYNTKISAGDNLPDMTQTEFIKSVAKVFGIIFQTNSFTKTVEFKQFKDIYDNVPNAINWSNKLDLNTTNKRPTLSYHPEGYAQTNILKWTNEVSGTLVEELGEGSIIVADQSLEEEKDLIVIPFSATEMSKKLIDLDVPVIRFLKLGVPKGSVQPRMLIMERNSNVQITYNDTVDSGIAGNSVPLCYFQLEGKTFNLGFDDSLIDDNYEEFNFFLDKYKKLTAYYNLNENDISDLDFFVPIYDDFYQHYFFISKIDKFVANRSTKIQLIRL